MIRYRKERSVEEYSKRIDEALDMLTGRKQFLTKVKIFCPLCSTEGEITLQNTTAAIITCGVCGFTFPINLKPGGYSEETSDDENG